MKSCGHFSFGKTTQMLDIQVQSNFMKGKTQFSVCVLVWRAGKPRTTCPIIDSNLGFPFPVDKPENAASR